MLRAKRAGGGGGSGGASQASGVLGGAGNTVPVSAPAVASGAGAMHHDLVGSDSPVAATSTSSIVAGAGAATSCLSLSPSDCTPGEISQRADCQPPVGRVTFLVRCLLHLLYFCYLM